MSLVTLISTLIVILLDKEEKYWAYYETDPDWWSVRLYIQEETKGGDMAKDPEVVKAEMDEAADVAASELAELDAGAVKVVKVWWEKHYKNAGHKRLGRVLLAS